METLLQRAKRSFTGKATGKKPSKNNNEQDVAAQEALKLSGCIPEHIAIIMDGNGRWAKRRGKLRVMGHNAGVESVRDIVEASAQIGVKYLTLYTFSKENWKRPKQEVAALMQLLIQAIRSETETLHQNNVRLNVIGSMNDLPEKVQNVLLESLELTRGNTGMVLSLALSYSGRWEITQATKKIAEDVRRGFIDPEDISDETFERYLETYGMPHPELLIRTSGEFRLSNFLLWQLAYTEIYISNCYWPDFRRGMLYEAIRDYQGRERRYGMTSEQLENIKALELGQSPGISSSTPSDNQY